MELFLTLILLVSGGTDWTSGFAPRIRRGFNIPERIHSSIVVKRNDSNLHGRFCALFSCLPWNDTSYKNRTFHLLLAVD